MTSNILYLSKRNLQTLLNKLERFEAGQETQCAIVKYPNNLDPYSLRIDGVCEHEGVMVIAIPDERYYVGRKAGPMLPQDDPDPSQAYTFEEVASVFDSIDQNQITVDFVGSKINPK